MPVSRSRPAPRLRDLPDTLTFPEHALLDALSVIASAASRLDVAEAVSAVLLGLEGVRGVAVTQRRDGAAIVIGSAGYSCDAMAAGTRLPLDSGLPAVEAIRTGRLVRQGEGPGWLAAPFGRRTTAPGALLLSLISAPMSQEADLTRLQRLATSLGTALTRAERFDRAAHDLAAVLAGLSPGLPADETTVAIRQAGRGGSLGGDIVLALPDGAGGEWLLAADVCGSGLPAATGAAAVRTAARALVPLADGPGHLLGLLDTALRSESLPGAFVTAVVVHVAGGRLRAGSAGHPAPLLLAGNGAVQLAVEPGPPLALETSDGLPPLPELETAAPAGGLLVLYTDGLTDRRGPNRAELDIAALLATHRTEAVDTTPSRLADALVAAADAAGPAADDTSVLVSRL